MDYVKTTTDYFAIYDGKGSFEGEAKDNILNFFHPDLVVETPDGGAGFNYDQWTKTCQGLMEKKIKAEVVTCTAGEEEATVEYEVRLVFPNGDSKISSAIGAFKDGKLIKVTPTGAKVHAALKNEFGKP